MASLLSVPSTLKKSACFKRALLRVCGNGDLATGSTQTPGKIDFKPFNPLTKMPWVFHYMKYEIKQRALQRRK